MPKDVTIAISGPAGMGMQSISFTLAKTLTRAGYYTYTYHDLMSRIRGGNNTSIVRIRTSAVNAPKEVYDILAVLDKQALLNAGRLKDPGFLIYDGDKMKVEGAKPGWLSVPLEKLALEAGKDKITLNSVATGAILALLEAPVDECFGVIKDLFGAKGEEVVANNIAAIKAGYEYVKNNFKTRLPLDNDAAKLKKGRLLITGSEAIGLGAIAAGVKFYSGYPMSPSTAVMEYIAARSREYNIVLEQAEDEIAAINMAIGAGYGGVRAMTSTSGGGFALMIEGVSLAGMTETPVVVVLAQRPGPATGFPTRTEQGDLNMVLHAGHGDFARVILAPRTAAEGPDVMGRAFNLAEKYQIPVFVLTDQCFADSSYTIETAGVKTVPIDRGGLLFKFDGPEYSYKRYALYEGSNMSPRLVPGSEKQAVYADSDEHTEEGHITEDTELRTKMTAKRLNKLADISKEIEQPLYEGPVIPKVVLTGWGSSYGALKDAVECLNEKDVSAGLLHFNSVWPFPELKLPFKPEALDSFVCVESNVTGQFADMFEKHTGVKFTRRVLRFDGRPLTGEYT